jgi:dihydroorotate dehydrogenase electron transfer subunit
MLKVLSAIIAGKKLVCYVSLEEVMACGVGACLGCVCKTTSGYSRICKEGPVFKIEDIVWE